MPRSDNTIVLVTRPKDSSARFVAELMKVAPTFLPIICPAFENVTVHAAIPDFDAAVFTSRAGVMFAPAGANRLAYCVGDATADAAREAGYVGISAQGSASDLTALILKQKPRDKLIHVRGEVSRGNVSETLKDAGIDCAEVVAYRKAPMPLSQDFKTSLKTAQKIVLPLFSSETVSILVDWGVDFSTVHVVAISDTVADAAAALSPASIVVSDRPDQPSMVAQTAALIA